MRRTSISLPDSSWGAVLIALHRVLLEQKENLRGWEEIARELQEKYQDSPERFLAAKNNIDYLTRSTKELEEIISEIYPQQFL